MNNQEYQMLAARTAKNMGSQILNLVHAEMGLNGEAGEFTDAVKRNFIYGKPLDVQNCVEELGDALWYVALACNTLGISMGEVMRLNIQKLQLRYPEKYTDQAAIERADKTKSKVLEHWQIDPNTLSPTAYPKEWVVKNITDPLGYNAAGPFDTEEEAIANCDIKTQVVHSRAKASTLMPNTRSA